MLIPFCLPTHSFRERKGQPPGVKVPCPTLYKQGPSPSYILFAILISSGSLLDVPVGKVEGRGALLYETENKSYSWVKSKSKTLHFL